MSKNQLIIAAFEHIRRDFSLASARGSVTKDLFVSIDGTNVTYKTVVNWVTVYEGPSSGDAARAYNDPSKVKADVDLEEQ
jgi:hypothetical protein